MTRNNTGCWSHPRNLSFCLLASFILIGGGVCLYAPSDVSGRQIDLFGPKAEDPKKEKEEEEEEFSLDKEFPGGTVLEIDPDVLGQLRRAMQNLKDGRVDVAVLLWQDILNQNAPSLLTKNKVDEKWVWQISRVDNKAFHVQTFHSVKEEVERVLASLNDKDRDEYLYIADGPARTLLAEATGEQRQAKLSEIVRRFYYSSVGEQAAFQLGCLLLDQQEFNGASRMFQKISQGHPNSKISKGEILLRLAVCDVALGDEENVQDYIKQAEKLDDVSDDMLEMVKAFAKQGGSAVLSEKTKKSGNWFMRGGNPARTSLMPSLPKDILKAPLTERWRYDFSFNKNDLANASKVSSNSKVNRNDELMIRRRMIVSSRYPYNSGTAITANPSVRAELLNRWKGSGSSDNSWMPVDQLMFYQDQDPSSKEYRKKYVFFKSYDRLISLDVDNYTGNQGDLENVSRSVLKWESAATLSKQWNQQQSTQRVSGNQTPNKYQERMLFGDKKLRSMTVYDGIAYFIKGTPEYRTHYQQYSRQVRNTSRLLGEDQLIAVDLKTGKYQWSWPTDAMVGASRNANNSTTEETEDDEDDEDDEEEEDLFPYDFTYLNIPVKHGDLLIAPVLADNRLWLYAMKTSSQSHSLTKSQPAPTLAWRTDLCDRPKSYDLDAAVGMCLDGGDIYLSTGFGAIFAVDANSGSVRWATRYKRTGFTNKSAASRSGYITTQPLQGAGENYVSTHGRFVAAMSVDLERVLFLDRRTGFFVYESPFNMSRDEYWLGIHKDILYTASSTSVHATNLAYQGTEAWTYHFKDYKNSSSTGIGTTNLSSGSSQFKHRSYGRGFLTPEGIYIPVEDAIHHLSLERKPENRVLDDPIVKFSGSNDEPVGNIFTDGETLFVTGGGRVYALFSLKQKMKILDKVIATATGEKRLEALRKRITLNLNLKDKEAVFKDMNLLLVESKKSKDIAIERRKIIDMIQGYHLSSKYPLETLRCLVGDAKVSGLYQTYIPKTVIEKPTTSITLIDASERAVLDSEIGIILNRLVKAESVKIDPQLILNCVFLSGEKYYLPKTVVTLLVKTEADGNVDLLKSYLKSKTTSVKMISLKALAKKLKLEFADDLKKMLSDPQEVIQLEAAKGLVNLNDVGSLSKLVELLSSADETIRIRSFQALIYATGQHFSYIPSGKLAERQVAVKKWQEWMAGDGKKVKLKIPLNEFGSIVFGRILISTSSRLYEFNLDGKQSDLNLSVSYSRKCQGLPNGNRLVSSYNTREVIEYDKHNKAVWRLSGLKGRPYSAFRTKNGNTIVAMSSNREVVEYDKNKRIVKTLKVEGYPYSAKRISNGNTLVVLSSGAVVEYDSKGVKKWSISNLVTVGSAQRLPNGNTLIAVQGNLRSVIEYNQQKEVVWKYTSATRSHPYAAKRLPDGRTVVADSSGVHMVGHDKKVIWSKRISTPIALDVY